MAKSGSGAVTIGGLPITSSAARDISGVGFCGYYSAMSGLDSPPFFTVGQSVNVIAVKDGGATDAANLDEGNISAKPFHRS